MSEKFKMKYCIANSLQVIPPLPDQDGFLANSLPVHRRFCSKCGEKINRRR